MSQAKNREIQFISLVEQMLPHDYTLSDILFHVFRVSLQMDKVTERDAQKGH